MQQTAQPLRILRQDRPAAGPESLAEHLGRFGTCPEGGPHVIRQLEASGLQGRGGARFPTWRKWDSVRERSARGAVVLANGAEGDPLSHKDRKLMESHPHLVIDGALLAAQSVGAGEVCFYLEDETSKAWCSLQAAVRERKPAGVFPAIRFVRAPHRYVAGEETAAVAAAAGRPALPRFRPPRPYERGVHGLPTLVQNVETLVWAALISRWGGEWFRTAGTRRSAGPLLVTVSGAVRRPGVQEVPHGYPLSALLDTSDGDLERAAGVLVGGYFGAWISARDARAVTLDDASLARVGGRLGCGPVHLLGPSDCGVTATARMLHYLAVQSAEQCGPCRVGLPALAAALQRIAARRADRFDQMRLERWAGQLTPNRGACAHPDGAVALLQSALRVFAADFEYHRLHHDCLVNPVRRRSR